MKALRLRLWRSPAKWLFIPVVALSLWVIESLRYSGFAVWSELAPGFMYGVLVMGPIAAALAGLRAWTEKRAPLMEINRTAARSPVALHATSALADAGWVVGAYFVAIAVTVARVGIDASWGSPDVGGLAAALAAVVACSGIGWAVGWWFPSRLTGPLSGIVLYVLMGLAISLAGGRATIDPLVPTAAHTGLRPMETVGDWTGGLQFGWFAGLAVLLLGATVVAVSRRRGITLILTGLALATVCAVPLVGGDSDRRLDPAAPMRCVTVDSIEVCTHPAYGEAIGPMAEAVAATLQPLFRAGLVSPRVMDVAFRPEESDTTATFNPHPDIDEVSDGAAGGIAHWGRCPQGETIENIDAVDFLRRWLVVQAGYLPPQQIQQPPPASYEAFVNDGQRAAFERFEGLDDAAQVEWLRVHFRDVVTCQIEIGAIP